MWAARHQKILAVVLILVCAGYGGLSFAYPHTATALTAGFIGFVIFATLVLRLHRKV